MEHSQIDIFTKNLVSSSNQLTMNFFEVIEQQIRQTLPDDIKRTIFEGLNLMSISLSKNQAEEVLRVGSLLGEQRYLSVLTDYYALRTELYRANLMDAIPELIVYLQIQPLSPSIVWFALLKGLLRNVGKHLHEQYTILLGNAQVTDRNKIAPLTLRQMYRYICIVKAMAFDTWNHEMLLRLVDTIDDFIDEVQKPDTIPPTLRKWKSLLLYHCWYLDKRFLVALCSMVTSSLKIPFIDLLSLAIRTAIDRPSRRREWDAARIIQRAVRKYIYGPGMPGTSRGADSMDISRGLLTEGEASVSIILLRKIGRHLVNRMSRRELLEILRKHGPSHAIEVS